MAGRTRTFGWAAAIAILVVVPFVVPVSYVLHVFILCFVYGSLATSWNLMAGYCGQVSLGQASFSGLGGYTMALLWLAGIPPPVGMVAGGLMAMVFAVAISPCLRLRGMYFAIGTLGLTEALRVVMSSWYDVTGGAQGLYLPIPKNFSIIPYYYISLLLMFVTILSVKLYVDSRIGLALIAIREDEDAAKVLGVNTLKYKILTFMVSALLAGIIGGFYAYYALYIEPNNLFGVFWSVIPLFMAIIGGVGTIYGPLLGAVVYIVTSEILVYTVGEINMTIFGAVLIAIIILRPEGLAELLGRLLR